MTNSKVDAFIYNFPKEIRKILLEIREIVMESAPFMEEQFKYKIPFYSCYGPLLYINPKESKVIVGFMKGSILAQTNSNLVGEQKIVRHFIFNLDYNIQTKETFRQLIQEAIILNEISYIPLKKSIKRFK